MVCDHEGSAGKRGGGAGMEFQAGRFRRRLSVGLFWEIMNISAISAGTISGSPPAKLTVRHQHHSLCGNS